MPSKELKKLKKKLKGLYNRNKKTIFDIMLFGSFVRGEYKPQDVDAVVILRGDVPQEKIKSILSQLQGFHAEYLFLDEIYKEPLWSTIISEGFSISKGKYFHEILGMTSWFLYTYDLSNLVPSEKSQFSHAIFGRAERTGLLKELGGKPVGRGSAMVPVKSADKMRAVLERWKVNYNVKKVLVF